MVTTADRDVAAHGRSAEEERLIAERRKEKRQKWIWRITGYVVVLGLWQFASGRLMDEALLPGPIQIAQALVEIWQSGRLFESFAATFSRIGIGFALSFLIGTVIGLLTQIKWFSWFTRDATVIGLTAPGLVWALTGVIIWGFRPMGWIFAIVASTWALVSVNISEGIRALPAELLDMAKAFGVPKIDRQRHIVIPNLAPYVFNSIRFGFSIAWKVTVLTEVFASNKGIGFEMRVATQVFQLDKFFAWAFAFFAVALFLEKVVLQSFERRFFRWRKEVTTS